MDRPLSDAGPPSAESLMLRIVCHEFRAPLSSLGSLTRALSDERCEVNPDARRRIAELAHDQAVHLEGLLRQAAAVTRGLTSAEPVGRRVPLHRVVPAATGVVPRHRLRTAVTGSAAAYVVDGQRVQHILTNLLDNAVRHGPDGGQVRLGARVDRRGLVLTVTDQGRTGDALAAALARPVPPAGLSGLGLWVVRRLVGVEGGTVRARPGRPGVAVEVVLPARPADLPGAGSARET